MTKESNAAGRASIDRPWMQHYPAELGNISMPHSSVTRYLKDHIQRYDGPVLHYYGNDWSWRDLFEKVDAAARSLKALGISEGDHIPVFLQAVPEFLVLLLAVEKIGAALICRDNTPEENADAIRNSGSPILFAHDYLSKEEEDIFYNTTQLEKIILISPYNSADKEKMPNHIKTAIEARYSEASACSGRNMIWGEFLDAGEGFAGECEAAENPERPLFCAYTSGSTGTSKQVIHTAESIVGILYQMEVYAPAISFRLTWLHTILPPALVAVTVSMMLNPIATNKMLILDPFCEAKDLDLELMRYKPNCWAMIPMFVDIIMNSKRIPEDYVMDHLYAVGAGAEALNNKQIREIQAYLKEHNCPAAFSLGYGQSEGGSNFTLPSPNHPLENCCYGIPMPATVLAAFDPKTNTELGYGEIGEICKYGPGNMIGYDNPESTKEALQVHDDGKLWLHTGDFGYITKDGNLYILGRGLPERFGGGYLFALEMENRVVEVEGVKDAFFVVAPDKEHEGYYLPYLYVVLEKDAEYADVEHNIREALEKHQNPVKITVIPKRPYYHFKTNRKELTEEIMRG